MTLLLVVVIATAVLLVVEGLNWVGWTAPQAVGRGTDRYVAAVGLDLPSALRPAVSRRLAAGGRLGSLGGIVGGLAAGWAVAPFVVGNPWDAPSLAVLAGAIAGHAVGETVVVWRESRRVVPSGPRLARVTVPAVGDYVRPQERIGGWAMVVAALVTGLVLMAAPGSHALRDAPVGVIAILLALPLVAVLLAEDTARRLVARPQVADSALALAWDDAVRALALRGLVRLPYAASVAVVFVIVFVRDRAGDAIAGSPVDWLLLAAVCTASWWPAWRSDVRRFRERLWPVAPQLDGAVGVATATPASPEAAR